VIGNFVNVGTQVCVLVVLIFVGFLCGKRKIINDSVVGALTDLVLYVAAPCIIIVSFQREFDVQMLKGLGLTAFAAVVIFAINIIVSNLLIHDKDSSRECVLRFGSIFSNCGFMGIPLVSAVLGSEGVFYLSAYLAVFGIVSWTYGVSLMNKGKEGDKASWAQILINPGNIGTAIGLFLYFASIRVPSVLYTAMDFLGALNTPLPMMVIGYQLSTVSLLSIFKDKKQYLAILIRLVIVPLLSAICFIILRIDMVIAVACIIAASAPAAALTTMFSAKYQRDVKLSVSIVSVSTLLSVLTMPIIVGMVQYFLM